MQLQESEFAALSALYILELDFKTDCQKKSTVLRG